MITFHRAAAAGADCNDLTECASRTEEAVWIDLLEPTQEEESALEQALGVDVPTRHEIQDITTSSRLYQENGSLFMTATILTKADTSHPEASAILFILSPGRLITVRYAQPLSFDNFRRRRDANPAMFGSAARVFEGLIDAIVERIADILENVGAELEAVSLEVFATDVGRGRDFRALLGRLGRLSDLASKARESLLSLSRVFWFFEEVDKTPFVTEQELPSIPGHIRTVTRDIASLNDHASFLSGKIAFLLDASLGLINVEQNGIIKIFSVAAVIFLPPTLVASIYGMNFEHMPELRWLWGYPFAVVLMIGSAILPFYLFKHKGWL